MTNNDDPIEARLVELRRLAEAAAAGPQMFAPGEVDALIAHAERDPTVWPILENMLAMQQETCRELGIDPETGERMR